MGHTITLKPPACVPKSEKGRSVAAAAGTPKIFPKKSP